MLLARLAIILLKRWPSSSYCDRLLHFIGFMLIKEGHHHYLYKAVVAHCVNQLETSNHKLPLSYSLLVV